MTDSFVTAQPAPAPAMSSSFKDRLAALHTKLTTKEGLVGDYSYGHLVRCCCCFVSRAGSSGALPCFRQAADLSARLPRISSGPPRQCMPSWPYSFGRRNTERHTRKLPPFYSLEADLPVLLTVRSTG
jgi:hypothetical protein